MGGAQGPGGMVNVLDFQASGSTESTHGTITAASRTLHLTSPIDWQDGQGLALYHAGDTYRFPAPPLVTAYSVGAPGTTPYAYAVATFDPFGGVSGASQVATATTGPASLSSTAYNVIQWTSPSPGQDLNVVGFAVYGRTAGSLRLLGFTMVPAVNTVQVAFSASPAPPSMPGFTPGSTYAYLMTGTDFNGNEAPSPYPAATIESVTQGATLRPVTITWNVGLTPTGAPWGTTCTKAVNIYRSENGGPFLLLAADVPWGDYAYQDRGGLVGTQTPPAMYTYVDQGQPFPVWLPPEIPATPPTGALGGTLRTVVASGGGTPTLNLRDPALFSVSDAMVAHDDTEAFNSAMSAANATHTGGTVLVPGGRSYNLSGNTMPGEGPTPFFLVPAGCAVVGTDGWDGQSPADRANNNRNLPVPGGLPTIRVVQMAAPPVVLSGNGATARNLAFLWPYQTVPPDFANVICYPAGLFANGLEITIQNIVILNAWIGISCAGGWSGWFIDRIWGQAMLHLILGRLNEFSVTNVFYNRGTVYNLSAQGAGYNLPYIDGGSCVRLIASTVGLIQGLEIDDIPAVHWTVQTMGGTISNVWQDDTSPVLVLDTLRSPDYNPGGQPFAFMLSDIFQVRGGGGILASNPEGSLYPGANASTVVLSNSVLNGLVECTGSLGLQVNNCQNLNIVGHGPVLRATVTGCTWGGTNRFDVRGGQCVAVVSGCMLAQGGAPAQDVVAPAAALYVYDRDQTRTTRYTIPAGTPIAQGYNLIGHMVLPQQQQDGSKAPTFFNVLRAYGLGLGTGDGWALEDTATGTRSVIVPMNQGGVNDPRSVVFGSVVGEGVGLSSAVQAPAPVYQAAVQAGQNRSVFNVWYYAARATPGYPVPLEFEMTWCQTPSTL